MKIIALAVLLAVVQANLPTPRKAPDNTTQAPAQVKSKGDTSQAKPLPAQLPVETDSNRPAKGDSTEQHSENTQHTVGISKLPPVTATPTKRDWADWAYWGFNLLLVAVGGFQVYLLFPPSKGKAPETGAAFTNCVAQFVAQSHPTEGTLPRVGRCRPDARD